MPSIRILLLTGALPVLVVLAQLSATRTLHARSASVEGGPASGTSFLPDSAVLRVVESTYGGFLGSLYWVQSIMTYAGVVFDNEPVGTLPLVIRAVTVLDPRWEWPYEFGGLVFDQDGTRQEALAFFQDGVAHFPRSWRLRIHLAMMRQSLGLPDSATAEILIPLASDTIEAPAHARTLAFTLLQRAGRAEEAMRRLLAGHALVNEGVVRYQMQNKVFDLLRRESVDLGADSADFRQAVSQILSMTSGRERDAVESLLVDLVKETHRQQALAAARDLARQWRAWKESGA